VIFAVLGVAMLPRVCSARLRALRLQRQIRRGAGHMTARLKTIIVPLSVSVVVALAAAGCGGGGSSGSVTPTTSVISGSAERGFTAGSMVQAYGVNPADGSDGAVLGSSTTDEAGFFKLSVKPQTGPVRLVVSGGSFLSEANGATILPSAISALHSSAPAGPVTINVNPLTDFIDQMAVVNITKLNQSFVDALSSATSKVEQVYGLSSDPAQLLANYAATGTDAANLGLILGALINEDQILCSKAPGGLVTALATDLADGAFDGKDADQNSIDYCGGDLAAIAGTSAFEDALSGLQQLQIVSQGFAFGGTGNLLSTNGLANLATGGSISYPLAPLAQINSAIGPNATPPSVNAFAASTPGMNAARENATATLLPNGKVLIAGGYSNITINTGSLSSTEIYSPVTNTFAASPPSMNQARTNATATLLPNGRVLIAGGLVAPTFLEMLPFALSSTEIYDPASNTFATSTPNMNDARTQATATLLPNGKLLIAGGFGNTGDLSSTEIYDSATNTFATSTPSMKDARENATAALLPNGDVLIAGGSGNGTLLASTEIYDPATNSFATSTPSMKDARALATGSLLPNGEVLIAGGSGNGGVLASTEIYDPDTNSFATSTPSMKDARALATATLLPNGKVLIAGGIGAFNPNEDLASIEIYDPVSNTFAASTPSMKEARDSATATLLLNGKVLIAGGGFIPNISGAVISVLSSTEVYSP
jgi:hypothetical protein